MIRVCGRAPDLEIILTQILNFKLAAAKLSKRYTNHCVRTTALEQFSTSRRVRSSQSVSPSASSTPTSSPKSVENRTPPMVSPTGMSMNQRQSLQVNFKLHSRNLFCNANETKLLNFVKLIYVLYRLLILCCLRSCQLC